MPISTNVYLPKYNHIHLYTHVHTYLYTYLLLYTPIRVLLPFIGFAHIYVYIHIYPHIHICLYTYTYPLYMYFYTHIHTSIYIYPYAHLSIHLFTHSYIPTFIYIQANNGDFDRVLLPFSIGVMVAGEWVAACWRFIGALADWVLVIVVSCLFVVCG